MILIRNRIIALRTITIVVLVLTTSLRSPCLFAEQKGSLRLYPLPSVEAEGVLSRWLVHSGFEVSRSSLEGGTVRLIGLKQDENWEIVLRPHSPLASSIQAQFTLKGQPVPAKLEALWNFLEDYSKGPFGEENSLSQGIPDGVLSKKECVVCIITEEKNDPLQLSGFIVDRSGLVLSTAHDLKRNGRVMVILSNNEESKGRLVKIDLTRDLALVEVQGPFPSFMLPKKRRDPIRRGEKIYSIGCPDGQHGVIHVGYINGPLRQKDALPLWQVDMKILPGSSGSPVFDGEGNLVGVVKGRYRGTEAVGFLIPIETMFEFLKGK